MSELYLYKGMLLIDHLVLWQRWRPALSVRNVVYPIWLVGSWHLQKRAVEV